MNPESGAVDQVMRAELMLTETAIRLAASGAVQLAGMLVAILRNEKQISGKTDIIKMIQEGKPITAFPLEAAKMKDFSDLAKQYGMMFSIVRDRNHPESVDVIVKEEDARIVNRIRAKIGAEAQVADEKNVDAGLSGIESANPNAITQHRPASMAVTTKLSREQADSMLSRLDTIRAALEDGAEPEQCRHQLRALQDELGRALGMPERSQSQFITRAAKKTTPLREQEVNPGAPGKQSIRDKIDGIKGRFTYEGQHVKPKMPLGVEKAPMVR